MKYAVQVNYRTHRGNASSRTFVVEANDESHAVEIAVEIANRKARKHPNVQSIVGIDVVEVFSTASVDWGKELTHVTEMRGKAIDAMTNHIPEGMTCRLSIPSGHGHIIAVTNMQDHGLVFDAEGGGPILKAHKVDTETIFQAVRAVLSRTFTEL